MSFACFLASDDLFCPKAIFNIKPPAIAMRPMLISCAIVKPIKTFGVVLKNSVMIRPVPIKIR